jgi:hypothetical protein
MDFRARRFAAPRRPGMTETVLQIRHDGQIINSAFTNS